MFASASDYGPFAPVVGYGGAIMAAAGALFLMWGGRMQKWRPPDEDLPGTGQAVVLLLCGVGMVLEWYLATPSAIPWFLAAVATLAVACVICFLRYSGLLGTFIYIKKEVTGENSTRDVRILGGRELLPDAEEKRKKLGVDIQTLLEGAAYKVDLLWSRQSRQWVKQRVLLFFILTLVFGTFALTGAGFATQVLVSKKPTASVLRSSRATTGVGLPPGEPSDYFPHAVGDEWQYNITIGSVEPLKYQEVLWDTDKGTMGLGAMGFYPGLTQPHAKSYSLILRVQQSAPVQGPLNYDDGVELAVLSDGLDIFRDHHQIFWAITSSDRYMAEQIVTYPPGTPTAPGPGGPWGSWNRKDGYSMQVVFFADSPKMQVGLEIDPKDTVIFEGVESCQDAPCLHFVRTVEGGGMDPRVPDTPESRYLNNGLTEDTWFAKGKGLIGLEQKVNGKTSMTWKLKQFSPAD